MANTHTHGHAHSQIWSPLCFAVFIVFLSFNLALHIFLFSQSLSRSQQSGSVVQSWTENLRLVPVRICVISFSTLDVVGVCASMSLCNLCVAETDVISQKTSVSHVLKEKKYMQSPALGWVIVCASVCVCFCTCDCCTEMSFYCFINLLPRS